MRSTIKNIMVLIQGSSGLWGLSTLLLTLPPSYLMTKLEYKIFEKELAVKDEKMSLLQEVVQAVTLIKLMAKEEYWYNKINSVREKEIRRLIQARMVGAISGLL